MLNTLAKTPSLIVTALLTVALLTGLPLIPIGGEMLDARFGYSYEEAMESMESYGEPGRLLYVATSATLDIVLPLAYVGLLVGLMVRLRSRGGLPIVLPVGVGLFDLCENAQIVAMLLNYPDVFPTQVVLASIATQIKAALFLASVAAVLLFAVPGSTETLARVAATLRWFG